LTRTISLLGLCALLAGGSGCWAGNFEIDNPCDRVDCDDGSICTEDRCTFDLSGTTTCRYEPINDDAECGADDVTLVCKGGRCGAASLCDGVECDDDDLCTVDECAWDGTCTFTAVDCSDDNDCTDDSCDAANGECIHKPGEGAGFLGTCVLPPEPGDQQAFPAGICEEGVCVAACDPESESASPCPFTDVFVCCPGSQYCQPECL
jgi:hypothetical protein